MLEVKAQRSELLGEWVVMAGDVFCGSFNTEAWAGSMADIIRELLAGELLSDYFRTDVIKSLGLATLQTSADDYEEVVRELTLACFHREIIKRGDTGRETTEAADRSSASDGGSSKRKRKGGRAPS